MARLGLQVTLDFEWCNYPENRPLLQAVNSEFGCMAGRVIVTNPDKWVENLSETLAAGLAGVLVATLF